MKFAHFFNPGRASMWLFALAAVVLTVVASTFGSPLDHTQTISLGLAAGADLPLVGLGGLIITNQLLESLRRTFRQDFKDGFKIADPFWNLVATLVPSGSGANTYGWLSQFPQFREWVGDRVIKDMKEHGYQIVNRHFESSVGLNRNQIEDDNIGVYSPLFQEMGRAAAAFPDELIRDVILGAEVGLCYDGQPFFDTEHPVYANVDGTGANTPVSNVSGAGANPAWYLLDTSRSLKPFIYQQRRAPQFTSMTKMDDEAVFTSNEYRWGVDVRAEAGYGLWQMARKSTLALTAANFEAERKAMRQVAADGGRPMGCMPTVLLCGTELEPEAERILVSERTNGGDTNTNRGKAKIISVPWLD